jgi:hypothetical protein
LAGAAAGVSAFWPVQETVREIRSATGKNKRHFRIVKSFL